MNAAHGHFHPRRWMRTSRWSVIIVPLACVLAVVLFPVIITMLVLGVFRSEAWDLRQRTREPRRRRLSSAHA